MGVVYVAGAPRTGTATLGRALSVSPDLLVVDVRALLLEADELWCGDPDFAARAEALPSVRTAAEAAYATRTVPALVGVTLGLRRTPAAARVVVDRLQTLGRLAAGRTLVDVSATAPGILLWPMAGHRVVLAHCVSTTDVVTAPLGLVDHVAALAGGRLSRCARVTVPAHALRADPVAVAAALWPRPSAVPAARPDDVAA